MVMTKGGSVPNAGGPKTGYGAPTPRANVTAQQPYTAPSTARPDGDQNIEDAAVNDGIRGPGQPGGTASHGAYDAAMNGLGAPTKPGAAPPKIGRLL